MLRAPQTRTARIQLALVMVFLIAFAIAVRGVAGYVDRIALFVDLRDAISRGDLEIVQQFEREGVDWRDLNDLQHHYSPLFEAVKRGHLELVRYFVENDADVFESTPDGYTAPGIAALRGRVTILKYLLMDTPHGERIAREDRSIHPIGPYADLELVAWLRQRVDLKKSIWGQDALRLLCLAVQQEDEDMLEFLLEIGAPDAMTPNEWDEGFYRSSRTQEPSRWLALYKDPNLPSPLHIAAQVGNMKIVQQLLDHGANPKAKDPCGQTSIDYARRHGHESLAILLERARHED